MTHMKSDLVAHSSVRLLLLAVSIAAVIPSVARAQTTAAPSSPVKTLDNQTVTLDPFNVTADESGYRATNSVVATGFNRDIEHTPLIINVVTEDMIRDAGLTNYADIAQFMPNTYVVPDPFGLGSTASARGQGTSYYTQDGMRYYTEPIIRTGSRVEVIKGPATLFFGRAQPGGIFNFDTRPPSAINSSSLTLTTGSFDKKMVDVGSQGKIDQKGKLTYRLDGSLQDNGTFLDYGFDRLKFIRGQMAWQVSDTFRISVRAEYSNHNQSGSSIAQTIISPQYYADYKNPRPQQISWAKSYYGLGALTDAAVATLLQGQWKENLSNWIVMTKLAYANDPNNKDGVYPTYATGVNASQTQYGWDYNAEAKGTYTRRLVTTEGGEMLWTPNRHVAIKASFYKYDLERNRLTISLSDVLADGTMRGSPAVRDDQNNSYTATVTGLFDYNIWKTHNTTNVGVTEFRDFYRLKQGTFYPLNAAPGVAKDPRPSTTAVATAGFNPLTDPYVDVSKLVQTWPDQVATPPYIKNYEDAIYASHIMEFFDGKVGLLVGGRIQTYEVKANPTFNIVNFKNTAGVSDINTVGLSWNITPNIVAFASHSKSFEPNLNTYLISGGGATQAEKSANPSPPVTGDGYDVGLKFGVLGRKLVGQVSLFQVSRLNDVAFQVADLAKTNADPRNNDTDPNNNVTWYNPSGRRVSKGMDLEMSWQPNKQFTSVFTTGWLPFAKVVQNDAIPFITTIDGRKIRDPNAGNYVGQRSPNAPKLTVSIWNHYKFEGTPWGVGLGASYMSETEIPQILAYQVTVPSYVNVRAGIDYTKKLSKGQLRLSAVAANLLDDRYYISTYRADPFNVTVQAAYQF